MHGQDIKQEAAARGVLVSGGEGFFVNPIDGRHHLRLTYSFAPPQDIERAVQILSEVMSNRE
jgi:DNA-binding transcriptional MocR family regulator